MLPLQWPQTEKAPSLNRQILNLHGPQLQVKMIFHDFQKLFLIVQGTTYFKNAALTMATDGKYF